MLLFLIKHFINKGYKVSCTIISTQELTISLISYRHEVRLLVILKMLLLTYEIYILRKYPDFLCNIN